MTNPWLERWQNNQIGWHEPDGNQWLKRYWSVSDRRVLVPLCGKTPDLRWLADRGNLVTGVELSPLAAVAFFEEQGLPYRALSSGLQGTESLDGRIRIVVSDFFDFDETGFDAVFDRAAFIALPPEVRPRYADHLSGLLTDNAAHLLVSLEYAVEGVGGPPFSVDADEVERLFPALEHRETSDQSETAPPKFRSANMTLFRERVWSAGL